MGNTVRNLVIVLCFFVLFTLCAFGAEPVKINDILFDNSDNLIYIKTKGVIDNTVTFQKGYLKDPERVYLDINNAILTTPKKSYAVKNSVFHNIKISQFTTEPNAVRIVFEYGEKFDLSNFNIYKTNDSIFIRTGSRLVENPNFKTVYSSTKSENRTVFYKGAYLKENFSIQAVDGIQNISNVQKNLKIPSKYYLDTITKTKDGVVISGVGKISVVPSFFLEDPERLIIDLDDTVVNPVIRNKVVPIGEIQTIVDENGQTNLNSRETIKVGQNSQSLARIVIQGENAKNYRGIISPDAKSIYISNKTNIINTKVADNIANLTRTIYSNPLNTEIISLYYDDSVTFNAFEENSNLYLDINNVNQYDTAILDPIMRAIPNIQTIRLALDKMRLVIPNMGGKSVTIKTNPDNNEVKIFAKKETPKIQKPKPDKEPVLKPAIIKSKKPPEISNLFKVVIDAGHGGADVGATRDDINEKDITLSIAKMVEKNLNKKNVKTYMIRENDKTVSLTERCDFSNEKEPNVFVSIHVNSSLNDNIIGIETHWFKDDSIKYAEYVHNEMSKKLKSWKTIDRGLFKSQFYVINHTNAPAILCEIGFISNKNEREEIVKTKRQEEIADAISDGIYNYLKARK